MLYSIIPPELVFEDIKASVPSIEEAAFGGGGWRRLLLRQDPMGRAVIERVISTEPRDYLDPRLQPGMPHDGIRGY